MVCAQHEGGEKGSRYHCGFETKSVAGKQNRKHWDGTSRTLSHRSVKLWQCGSYRLYQTSYKERSLSMMLNNVVCRVLTFICCSDFHSGLHCGSQTLVGSLKMSVLIRGVVFRNWRRLYMSANGQLYQTKFTNDLVNSIRFPISTVVKSKIVQNGAFLSSFLFFDYKSYDIVLSALPTHASEE